MWSVSARLHTLSRLQTIAVCTSRLSSSPYRYVIIDRDGGEVTTTWDELAPRLHRIIDVRSPGEFATDHIPGAVNVPMLNDAQRAEVGAIYTQESQFAARRLGAGYVCGNVGQALSPGGPLWDLPRDSHLLLYCWRGGQRSHSLATILGQAGWANVWLLTGGYRAYRRRVMADLDALPSRFRFLIVSGLTGSGKSAVLEELERRHHQIVHLERLARHRGSMLGAPPPPAGPGPTQRQFDSYLRLILLGLDPRRPVWLECESRVVGGVHLRSLMWDRMCAARRVMLQVPLEARVEHILTEYAHWVQRDKAELTRVIHWLSAHHSPTRLRHWIDLIALDKYRELVADLLQYHYDPLYRNSRRGYFQCQDPGRVAHLTLAHITPQAISDCILPHIVSIESEVEVGTCSSVPLEATAG